MVFRSEGLFLNDFGVKSKQMLLFLRKMIADIFGESGDEEEEEFTVSSGSSLKAFKNQQKLRSSELLKLIYSSFKFHGFIEEKNPP